MTERTFKPGQIVEIKGDTDKSLYKVPHPQYYIDFRSFKDHPKFSVMTDSEYAGYWVDAAFKSPCSDHMFKMKGDPDPDCGGRGYDLIILDEFGNETEDMASHICEESLKLSKRSF